MTLNCAVCSQDKYQGHSSTAPHAGQAGICAGYQPIYPCGACAQDCELHEKAAPHAAPDFNCEACVPPLNFVGGGGTFGGGGATGGW